MTINPLSLIERDHQFIWHPFNQHGIKNEFLPVIKAKGTRLYLSNGQSIIDAISSWWVNLHGHANPEIIQAIYQQAQQLVHVIFSSFTHEPAVNFAEILINATQARGTLLNRVFYSDNGSTAVEVAMKMAYQYYINQGVKTRTRFLALNHSYHGDTLGCMSLSARSSYHKHFSRLLPQVDFIPTENINYLKQLLATNYNQYAALIIEPMIQAAGGMRIYSEHYLKELAELCLEENLLLICDEAFTGFYRTGLCFAFEHAHLKPDFLCLAKSITGGFLPLAATLTTKRIYSAFYSSDIDQAFLHGHSFTANPLACAAAIASWNILQRQETQAAITRINKQTMHWINKLKSHPNAIHSRCLGTVGAVNIRNSPDYFSDISYKIREYALEQGVLIRPLGPVLYAVPPYCSSNDEIDQIYSCIVDILDNVEKIQ